VIFEKEGWAFFEGFIMKHNVERFGGTLQGHGGSLLYYFPVVLVATMPHTGLFLRVFTRLKELWRDDLACYLLVWFAFVFVFFSLSGTKLPHYVLYGYTGLVILMAAHVDGLRSPAWALLPVLGFFVALLALPYGLHYAFERVNDDYYREALAAALGKFGTTYFAFCGVLAAIALFAMLERATPLTRKFIVFGFAAVTAVATLVVPIAGFAQQGAIKDAALLCRERHLEVVMWRLNAPSFSVYRGAPTPSRDPRPGDVVLTKANRLPELKLPYDLLYSKRGVVLAKIRA
jgi:4-amino-4-deoxy-L-arabinose transferase-like glycosyltransferase